MAKRNKKTAKISTDAQDTSNLSHNPFAALGNLKSNLPKAPPEPKPAAEPSLPQTPATPTPPARAVIRLERKGRGGKKVTVISHLGLDPEALAQWCAQLRQKAGCGGAVEDDALIVLQGDQRKRAAAILKDKGVRRITQG